MKIIAHVDADLEKTAIGTGSRLAESLAGVPVLRRTLQKLASCRRIARTVVTCPAGQKDAIGALLGDTHAELRIRPDGAPPYRMLVRSARKWSLGAWRGGLGGSCSFDEYTDIELSAAIAAAYHADAVAVLQPGAALLDPQLADAMMEHAERRSTEIRMTFAQAPPGLVITIFQTVLCQQLAANRIPPGWTLAYKPDDPNVDLAFKPCCYVASQSVRHAAGRLTADTSRSMRTMRAIIKAAADRNADSIGEWLIHHEKNDPEPRPREVEIELTTEDLLPDTPLRARGGRCPQRGPIALAHVERVIQDLAEEDDSLVVLGGHGDPVLHPQFGAIVRQLRQGGVYGICVYTTGQHFPDAVVSALVENGVDVVVFLIDAWTEATYQRVSGGAGLETVKASIERLAQARRQAGQPMPIIVPQMTKCKWNVDELDAFFDGWTREIGCATIAGFSHFGQRIVDLSVTDMSPPTRLPCGRILYRCTVLADGSVVACDQDFNGEIRLGHLGSRTLSQVWQGQRAAQLRDHHLRRQWAEEPSCEACQEWHRP